MMYILLFIQYYSVLLVLTEFAVVFLKYQEICQVPCTGLPLNEAMNSINIKTYRVLERFEITTDNVIKHNYLQMFSCYYISLN